MTDEKRPINESYVPQEIEKGYQPASQPTADPQPQYGYNPTTSGGDNPTNNPTPPGDE